MDKKQTQDRFILEEVPVSYEEVIKDLKKEKFLQEKEILTEILNKLDKIEKSVVG